MPYKLQKSGDGYYVVSKDTGRRHSKAPISRGKATAQLRAMYANVKDARG